MTMSERAQRKRRCQKWVTWLVNCPSCSEHFRVREREGKQLVFKRRIECPVCHDIVLPTSFRREEE